MTNTATRPSSQTLHEHICLVRIYRSRIGISRAGGSRSKAGVSAYTSGQAGAGLGGVRVFCNGVNVTPQSLLDSSPATKSKSKAGARKQPSGDVPTAATTRSSASSRGGGGGGGVRPRKTPSFSSSGEGQGQHGAGGGQGGGGSVGGVGKSSGRRKREGPALEEGGLTEEDLNAPITIGLSETPTMMLLEVRGSAVATDLRDFGRWLVCCG